MDYLLLQNINIASEQMPSNTPNMRPITTARTIPVQNNHSNNIIKTLT
jgi:hypothetical protein